MGISLILSALITEISILLAIQFVNCAIIVFNNIQFILIGFVFMPWIMQIIK